VERFINILIIEPDDKNARGLRTILAGGGNNVILVESLSDAIDLIESRDIGIMLIGANGTSTVEEIFYELSKHSKGREIYKIVVTENSASGAKLVQGFRFGAVDYISKPFNPKLVRAKIEVFKALYFKDLRINQLLSNIFPRNVLQDLNLQGKFSPQRIEEGTVLFTDFVAFSKIAKHMLPFDLLKKLEMYFNKFDEIIDRYELEKIKTMGDAYMAIAGVTEKNSNPTVRACLAALEMRDFMINQKLSAQAFGSDCWEVRIGIHTGPLVAGIIGSKKMSFDVWGDTVNIAARAEQNSSENSVTITDRVAAHAKPYFELEPRGEVLIKHGGNVSMYFIKGLKPQFSLFNEGKIPNSLLRKRCDLIPMDFEQARKDIINSLKSQLPDELEYHDLRHTLNTEKSAMRFAKLEGIEGEELILLRTAVLFHDAGYIVSSDGNEEKAIDIMKRTLPRYGYSEKQIELVESLIRATMRGVSPETRLQQILCDADHDYLGRADYHHIASKLRKELENYGRFMSNEEWIRFQLNYLENEHRYYTNTAINIRLPGKKKRIQELKEALTKLS
jgi:adenylate cyclase